MTLFLSPGLKANRFVYLLVIFFVAACGDEDRRGLEIDFPMGEDLVWEYDVYEIEREYETHIGTIRNINVGTTDHALRADVLQQRREFHFDSLDTPGGPGYVFTSAYYDEGDDHLEIVQHADDFYGIYDHTLTDRILDTLTANVSDGPDFQNFEDFEPGWITSYRFDERSNRNYEIHSPETIHLDFFVRDQHITGEVEIRTTGLYRRTERIDVPWRDGVLAHKVNVLTHMDFDVLRDSTEVPDFHETIKMKNWFSPDGGLIKREREPVRISIPGIPSRWGSVFDPGERWELTNLEGIDF